MEKASGKDLVKFNRWTDARRHCYYRIEDAQKETVPSVFEYRGVALRKSPMARYLQGLFSILFCLFCVMDTSVFGNAVFTSLLREGAASVLILLLGYRLAQMARDNQTGFFDRRYRRKVLYPLLVSRSFPLVAAYLVYYVVAVLSCGVEFSFYTVIRQFLAGSFAEIALIGVMFLEFLFVFPFLWKFLYSRDKKEVNKKVWAIIALYVMYELCAGLRLLPAELYRICFGRYLLSFSLGILLFIRRRKGLRLWEILTPFGIGVLLLAGGVFLSYADGQYRAWLSGFTDIPFSAGIGILLFFVVLAPLLTTYRYFRLVEPSHSVVALPGKAYYNIIMTAAVLFGLDLEFSVMGMNLHPQELFLTVLCIVMGILWHLAMRTKQWRYFVDGFAHAEKGLIRGVYWLKKKLIIAGNKLLIRYYDRKLKVEE